MRQIASSAKERQLLRISEGDTAPYEILKWHRTPKRQVTLALRFKSEQGFALLARSKACDRLQAVQRSISSSGFQREIQLHMKS